jgi:hypothetical protein
MAYGIGGQVELLSTRHYKKVCSQVHVSAALLPVSIEQEAEWVSQPDETLWGKKIILHLLKDEIYELCCPDLHFLWLNVNAPSSSDQKPIKKAK